MKPFKIVVAAALLAFTAVGVAQAQDKPEKPDIVLGVGGKSSLYYLPLTLAERLGYFKEQGLNVTITDFGGGSKSLQSLIGGSADVVTGAYEHTIRMQSKGQNIAAVIELGRFPGMVLAVKKSKAAQVKSFGDLKGMKIGVTAPGSSTNFFVNALIARDGVKPNEVSIIGVGTGLSAVAAIQNGDIDAICNIDPVMTKLEQSGDIVILADSRTDADNIKLFGGNNPAAVAYFKTDFIAKNPVTVQRLVNAFYKTVKWLEKASPDDIVKAVPEEYYLGDKTLYLAAVKASLPMYSRTGIISEQGMQNGLKLLLQFDPEMKDAKIDLNKTFDDRFVKKAAAGQMSRSGRSVTPIAIHRVTTLDLKVQPWSWPFAMQRRDEISAHFAGQQREKPQLWNGRVLLARHPVFAGAGFGASYFETDFAAFLAWRDWGFPDRDIFNGFGMGALRCADGAFVLGEMGQHTANAGRIYFPSGTPDLDDINAGTVDMAGSVAREVAEETGLTAADYRADAHWDCVAVGASVAMIRILHVDSSGEALRARIVANLARQAQPELCAIHLVRDVGDLTAAMPRFVTAFIEAQFSAS